MSKKSFILSQPATLSAADVVKRGKEKGLKFTAAYVYSMRSVSGKVAPKGGRKGNPRAVKAAVKRGLAAAEKEIYKALKGVL